MFAVIVGSTVGWGLFWEWCGWATFCVQILSANAMKRGAPQSWLSASGFSSVSTHYFACQKHIFCIFVEITIGTACEGMVAVHIALTWALGIVCGTGYILIFLWKEIRQWVNRCLRRCSVLMRLLNASVSVLWVNVWCVSQSCRCTPVLGSAPKAPFTQVCI